MIVLFDVLCLLVFCCLGTIVGLVFRHLIFMFSGAAVVLTVDLLRCGLLFCGLLEFGFGCVNMWFSGFDF